MEATTELKTPQGRATRGTQDLLQLVTFRVGSEEFGLDILRVQEIIRLQELTRVPNSSDFMAGVANLRGRVIPVVSLRKCFGLEDSRHDKQTRIVVAEHSLAHAHAGVYGDYSVRNVNTHYRQRYFVPVENQLRIGPEARKTITFSRLNLLDAPHMALMRNMDVIFCANVLIYFDLQSKRSAIEQFHSSLQPHGYLFLGHSESLYGVTDKFKLVHFPSATGYAKALPTTGS